MKISVAMPPWGQVLPIKSGADDIFHPPSECTAEPCAIHNPSHHMGEWDIVVRLDYGWPMIERTCPHGVGHPDPDSVAWFESHGKTFVDGHGCDGCCHKEE